MKQLTLTVFVMEFLGYIVHGLVLDQLWYWFIEPLGVPSIGLAHAIGLAVLIASLTNQYNKDVEENIKKAISHNLALPITALIVGYIAQLFM